MGEDSLELLEGAYTLIIPIMSYIRECKGNNPNFFRYYRIH